jgi:hypothetical protein
VADPNEHLTDFEEGARRALEWLGRSEDAAELAQIIGAMLAQIAGQVPAKLGDMENAFLIAIGRAALAGQRAAPQTEDEAKARPATLPPAEASPAPWVDVEEFRRRRLEHERRMRYEQLAASNSAAWGEQQHAFTPRNQMRNDSDWRG